MPCGRRCAGQRAGFAEVRKAEAGQGQGDCQAGPGREVRVRAWLSAIARLRESHGASWGRVALARPSGNVLVCGGRGRGAHRGVRYVVHSFDSRGCLGRQDEGRDHRRVFSHPSDYIWPRRCWATSSPMLRRGAVWTNEQTASFVSCSPRKVDFMRGIFISMKYITQL